MHTQDTNSTPSKAQSSKKGELNYQKILQSEILEESTPKFEENNNNNVISTKSTLDLFKINRQLKYHSEVKRVRKLKINKENLSESKSSTINEEKKLTHEMPIKSFDFENVSDNFYLNTLDMWDITRIALGTRNRLEVFDGTKFPMEEGFSRYIYDSPSEILCVKFLNSNRLVFSDGNCALKLKDLNREIEIFKFDTLQRKFLTIDFDPSKEHIVFLGSDKSTVDCFDLKERKFYHLYKHDNINEVCKVLYSPKNKLLISGGNDNKIIIFDIFKREIIHTFKHKAAVKGLALNFSEKFLASGGGTFDKTIKIWDLKKFTLISENLTDSQITNIEFFPNDILAVSNGYISNNINIFNLNQDKKPDGILSLVKDTKPLNILKKVSVFEKHVKRILYMSKSKCNNYLVSLSTDGNLKIWKVSRYINHKEINIDPQLNCIR
jgi:WD40 repeat protein